MRKTITMAAAFSLGLLACAGSTKAAPVTVSESGSTLLYPLFTTWASAYPAITPGVTLTSAATGSAAGTAAVLAGKATIGASDAYLSDEVAEQNPDILDIPLAISAQMINYNLPGLNGIHLRIDGPTLADIYQGKITEWNDPRIAAMNPAVSLPAHRIVPLRRADGSGDTFIFTQFLDFSADGWEDNPGYGTSIAWPTVAAEQTAAGNGGMIQSLADTSFSIGYVGISYEDAVTKAGLGTAKVKNQDGNFLLPTADTIAAAASALDSRTPSYERITLIFAPGQESYPLINYEYAVVDRRQPDPETAAALRDFLDWAISDRGGNDARYLAPVHFLPLPDFIRAMSDAQIQKIR